MQHRLLGLLLCVGACAPAEDRSNIIVQEVDSPNGISLNGTSLNGISLNGTSLDGTTLGATSVTGARANGVPIVAYSLTASPLTGAGFVGSTWDAVASNGAPVKLRIDTAEHGGPPNTDIWFYGVVFQTKTGWSPLCGAAPAANLAIPIAGLWDATATYVASATGFTFACRGKTIAKCVELGYKPYTGRSSQLASCVRLLRADYCGTGASNTVDGTVLDLYDNVGVQTDTEAWHPEAEWTPAGARCINNATSARYKLGGGSAPACAQNLLTTTCGTSFASGAVLIDELP